jgi:tRNA:m4X modification enzyme
MLSSLPPPPPGRRAAKPPKKPTSRGGYTTDRVVPPASWTRCHAYMERKVRFCHGQPVGDSNFCGAHQTIAARPRIPCPYDPSHTIYADMVESHWPKCPKYVEWQQQRQQPFYCQDCNTGGAGDFHPAVTNDGVVVVQTTTTKSEKKNLAWAQQVALRVIAAHQEIFNTTTTTTGPPAKDVPPPQQVTLADIHDAIPLVAANNIKSGGRKHLQQQASFIGHLRRVGALAPLSSNLSSSASSPSSLHKKARTELAANHDDVSEATQIANHEVMNTEKKHRKNRTILEVGAGRGITGLLVAGVSAADDRRSINHTTTTTKLVLVERDGARGGRADTTARRGTGAARNHNNNRSVHDTNDDNEVATTTTVSTVGSSSYTFDVSNLPCQRIKCDLAHVQLQIALQMDRTTSQARPADDDDNTDNIGNHHENKTAASSSNNEINRNNNDEEELIVVAKHLCGCGTDYALKSLRPLRDQISTLVMATCCHGACNWRDYVGRDYVRSVMVKKASSSSSSYDVDDDHTTRLSEFGDDEFKLLQLWSAGTVKVLDPRNKKIDDKSGSSSLSLSSPLPEQVERDDDEHGAAPVPAGLEETTKIFGVTRIVESLGLACGEQGLGRACQRIIDYGRREFISHELLQFDHATNGAAAAAAELIYYVPDSTTPQNAMLIATRRRADK